MKIRPLILLLCVVAFAAGCSSDDTPPSTKSDDPAGALTAQLHIEVVTHPGDAPRKVDISCPSVGDGRSQQQQAETAACAALQQDPALLDEVPDGKACTEIYGGDAVATVTGTVNGKRVKTTFSRVNGCEIARWDAAQGLWSGAPNAVESDSMSCDRKQCDGAPSRAEHAGGSAGGAPTMQ